MAINNDDIEKIRSFLRTSHVIFAADYDYCVEIYELFNKLFPPPLKLEVGKWYGLGGSNPWKYVGTDHEDSHVFSQPESRTPWVVGKGYRFSNSEWRECPPPKGFK